MEISCWIFSEVHERGHITGKTTALLANPQQNMANRNRPLLLLFLTAPIWAACGSGQRHNRIGDAGAEFVPQGGAAGTTSEAGSDASDASISGAPGIQPDMDAALDASPVEANDGEAGAPGHPISTRCGDAIRDPVTEECDDGAPGGDSGCTADCVVRAEGVASMPPTDAGDTEGPSLGSAQHVAAGTDDALAVTFQSDSAIWLQRFDGNAAHPASPVNVSDGFAPLAQSNAAAAPLPDGSFAVAWTDSSSGTPDVLLRAVTGSQIGPARVVHADTAGFQQDPDVLWVTDRLIVAWSDLLDVKYRAFDAGLQPLGPEQILAGTGAIESSVVLAPFADHWAAAVRANDQGLESIHIMTGATDWSTSPSLPSAGGDRPALVELDDQHLLVLFTVGSDPAGSAPPVDELRGSVLSLDTPGEVSSFVLPGANSPTPAAERLSRPSAARTGSLSYIGWQSKAADASARVFVTGVAFEVGAPNDLTMDATRELPINGMPFPQSVNLRLSGSSLFPAGALISIWQTSTLSAPDRLVMDFRPSPFVFLATGDGG